MTDPPPLKDCFTPARFVGLLVLLGGAAVAGGVIGHREGRRSGWSKGWDEGWEEGAAYGRARRFAPAEKAEKKLEATSILQRGNLFPINES